MQCLPSLLLLLLHPTMKRRQQHGRGITAACSSCLWESVASAWVDFYHAAFVSKQALANENNEIRIALIQKDLSTCQHQLELQEQALQERISTLEREAMAKKRARDLSGAKKKMVERRRTQAQLDSLRDSMSTIDLHRSTIERSMLNRTVLESLRAAGDVLRQMGATREGISSIERVVDDVEEQVESASTITKILAAGSVSGMVNTMAIDGVVVDEDELMQELDMLLEAEEEKEDHEDLPFKDLPSVPLAAASSHSSSLATNPSTNAESMGSSSSSSSSRNKKRSQQQQIAAAAMQAS